MEHPKPRPMVTGFTLIELLVLVVIIGLLAALLLPVYACIKGNARRITCISNLRQLGTAVSMYAQDTDGVFVQVVQEGQSSIFWFQLLQPYIKNTDILKCPEDDTESWTKYGRASYGYNSHLGGVAFPQFAEPTLDSRQKDLAQVARPASTVLMTDSGTVPLTESSPDNWPAIVPCPPEIGDSAAISSHSEDHAVQNGSLAAPRARHANKTNVLWVDGHAATQAITAFYVSPGVIAPGETVPGYSPCLRPEKGCR